jgi:hypothetical protein
MIRITTIAEQHDFNCARLKRQLRRNGVPLVRSQKVLFLKDQDLLRCQMLIARLKLSDAQPRTPEQLRAIEYRRKRYVNEVRAKQGLEPMPIVRGRPKLTGAKLGNYSRPPVEKAPELTLDVIFMLNGVETNGVVVGGSSRLLTKKVLIRYTLSAVSNLIDVTYDKVLHSAEHIDKLVSLAKKTNSKEDR